MPKVPVSFKIFSRNKSTNDGYKIDVKGTSRRLSFTVKEIYVYVNVEGLLPPPPLLLESNKNKDFVVSSDGLTIEFFDVSKETWTHFFFCFLFLLLLFIFVDFSSRQ